MRVFRLCLLAALALLAACATPREQCLRAATRDLSNVDRLIDETQANLNRGYALEREAYTAPTLEFCYGNAQINRGFGVGFSYCRSSETRFRERPVAIDATQEARKLANLKQTRSRLAREATTRTATCPP